MSWCGRLGLLGKNRAYTALWGARTVSTLGNWITLTALLLYLESTGAAGMQVGIALAARELPHLLGPFTGALADRLDPRRLMIACDLGNSVVIASIAIFLPSYPILVALIAASSAMTALFLPSGKAAVPKLVPARDLTAANALLGSSTNLSYAIGPLLGALIFAGPGVRAAFLVDAGTFVVSTTLLMLLPALGNAKAQSSEGASREFIRFIGEIRDGLTFVARHQVSRAVALGMFLGVLFAGIDNVALVFLLRDTLGGPEIAVGASLGIYAIAMILAPLALIRFTRFGEQPGTIVVAGLLMTSIGLVLTGVSPVVIAAIAAYSIAGAGNGLENIGVDTLIGKTVPSDKLGRAFGVVYGPIFIAGGAAALIGGQLVDLTSPPVAFVVAGAGVGVVAVMVWRILPEKVTG
jgi:MFS family permease